MQFHFCLKSRSHSLFCVAMALVTSFSLLGTVPALARSIIPLGNASTWKYLDTGQAPSPDWAKVDFDDSQWKSGTAPLGYGRTGLGTKVGWGPDENKKYSTTWFRHAFDRPELDPGERLAIHFCIDDGAFFYLNGRKFGYCNLSRESTGAGIHVLRPIGSDEGFYWRLSVPVSLLRPGRNVLAVEVHQCAPDSHDIFFDLALKILPPDRSTPVVPAAAREIVTLFNRRHYIGPGIQIPDGYADGGRAMKLVPDAPPTSGREILLVDREHDAELARRLAYARSPELQSLPPIERARRIAAFVHRETTPPGGIRWCDKTCELLLKEFANKPVFIGDWIEQANAGMCRHRALLFKILGDEAGLKVALVRGNYIDARGPHVWNEICLNDGRRLLVDIMMKGDRQDFPEVTSPGIVSRYLQVDNKPWYGGGDRNQSYISHGTHAETFATQA